jgi:hypothetical protein
MYLPDNEENKMINRLLYDFVRAIAAGKSVGLCLKRKPHAENVTHGFAESQIGFMMGAGIDIGMHFHLNLVLIEYRADLIGNADGFMNFGEHTLFNGEAVPHLVEVEEHEAAAVEPYKHNGRGKFHDIPFYLGICANAHFKLIAFGCFILNRFFDLMKNIV